MAFLHKIRTVAKNEAKTLRRSWFFRLFSLGALFIFSFMNLGLFSPVGDESWELISTPSTVPLVNLYLLNIGQSLVIIFLAADFLKRDKKVDTNEVLYTRSISNFEYVTGKTLGIIRLFLGLNLIVLGIALIMNIISEYMSVDLLSYLWYILLVSVPTLMFSLGLAFMLMSLLRNQAITFLILLGLAALNMFWGWYRMGSMFDYMAFGLPLFKSSLAGFGNLSHLVNQRLLYFFLGLALVLATVLLFKRLPQSKPHTALTWILLVLFLSGAAFCGVNTYSFYSKAVDEKALVIETNRKYENRDFASLTDARIDLEHKGGEISAKATLVFRNDNVKNLDTLIFSLNPYLNVSEVFYGGTTQSFRRINHIIEIDLAAPLTPGGSDSVSISYAGSVAESFCYPDYTDNPEESPYRVAMLNIGKRQSFLTDNFVLLIPETHWYPVPSLNYYPSNPARINVDFTNFTLRVKTAGGLRAVAQGSGSREAGAGDTDPGKAGTDDGGSQVFTPEAPLTGLTLAIGDYRSDTLTVDSVKYVSWYFPGHDYYKKDLAEIRDTLPFLVSGIMRELEATFSTRYPFKTLSFVEVPVQFYSYPRLSTQTRAELQPSMVLMPEKLLTLENAGFGKRFSRQKKRMEKNNQVITDKELQIRLFNDFVRNAFISGENVRYVNGRVLNEPVRYRLAPSFYFFKNNFYSAEYPVINAVFESHLQKVTRPGPAMWDPQDELSDNDNANIILRDYSFRDLLALNPGGDTLPAVLTLKGDHLFNLIRSQAGIEDFNTWFKKYIDDNRFRRVDVSKLDNDIKERFGFGFYPFLDDWFNSLEQPGFLLSGLQAEEIVAGDRVRYLVTFTAANPEPVSGIFNVSFRTGGPGGGGGGRGGQPGGAFQGRPAGIAGISMQGRGMESADITRIVSIGPAEAKKISIILDAQPRAMLINTLFAKNIPGEITLPIGEIRKLKSRGAVSEEDEILPSLPQTTEPGELIVDNEDPGFDPGLNQTDSPLKRLLGITNSRGSEYRKGNQMYAPEYWQPVVLSAYYGDYIRSAVNTRAGTGDKTVKWSVKIEDPGYYDIFCYIGKAGGMMGRIGQRPGAPGGDGGQRTGEGPGMPGEGQQPEPAYKDMHYKVYHDEGVDEITVDFMSVDPGWNNLGRYYLSSDSARVELTNQSTGRVILGDAIRWVKVN